MSSMLRLLPGISSSLISTLLVHSPPNFSETSPKFFFSPVLAAANTGSCVGPQNKIDHLAGCRLPVLSARGIYIGSKKHMTCGVMTCEMNNLEKE